ncbi:phosphopantothenate synthase, partial [Burkholderia cenocepacia]|nr:phosphopantothenate synthase [Burkholderia cenocepacia]
MSTAGAKPAVPFDPRRPELAHAELAGKHLVLGLTGGIACYKIAELTRLL